MHPELLSRDSDGASNWGGGTTKHLSATLTPHPGLGQPFHLGCGIFSPSVQLLTLTQARFSTVSKVLPPQQESTLPNSSRNAFREGILEIPLVVTLSPRIRENVELCDRSLRSKCLHIDLKMEVDGRLRECAHQSSLALTPHPHPSVPPHESL